MSQHIHIKDSCPCGADFILSGEFIFVAGMHRDWMKSHEVCRNKTEAVRQLKED